MSDRSEGQAEVFLDDPERPPLPIGDPLAWGVLVAGTSLEGTDWPGWGNSGWDAPAACTTGRHGG